MSEEKDGAGQVGVRHWGKGSGSVSGRAALPSASSEKKNPLKKFQMRRDYQLAMKEAPEGVVKAKQEFEEKVRSCSSEDEAQYAKFMKVADAHLERKRVEHEVKMGAATWSPPTCCTFCGRFVQPNSLPF